jgi:hypothetical protein
MTRPVIAERLIGSGAAIVCFATGLGPVRYASPMPRSPMPPSGRAFDGSFGRHFADAVALNDAVHDGAVIVTRASDMDDYRIRGWSFRLHPPPADIAPVVNMGSAFNSCLFMSKTKSLDCTVDFVVKPAIDHAFLFEDGFFRCIEPQ